MSTLFATVDTLRSQYRELTFSEITGSNTGSEKLLIITAGSSKMFSLINATDVEVTILVENSDDPNHKKILFTKLSSCEPFTLDAVSGAQLNFPSACRIWVHTSGIAATSGKVRCFLWG